MATHDYSLANQSGASFRTDLNNALAAIVSGNSSGASPSTTFAYMEWNDTSAGVKKIRNSNNTGWIELFQLDGTLTMESGATGTPGLAIRGDLNTGIWSSGADLLNFSTGGTERLELGAATVFNDTGADVDFRIEGSTAGNLFYVDAGNNRIGIRTNSPDVLLHLEAANTPSAVNNAIRITDSDANVQQDQVCGRIEFETADSSTAAGVNAQIDCIYSGTAAKGELQFRTGQAGSLVDTLRLEDNGDMKVGAGDLYFGTSGKGIVLGVTSNTAANTLDDFEEGTCTLSFADANSGGNTASSGTVTGLYTKTGQQVFVQFRFVNINTSGMTGGNNAYVQGLPFAGKASQDYRSAGTVWWQQITGGTDEESLTITTIQDSTTMAFVWSNSEGAGGGNVLVSQFDSGQADVMVSIVYTTDA